MKQIFFFNIVYHTKILIAASLFLTGNIVCLAQGADKIERKQLFDYQWKFYQGDTAAAKSRDFNDPNWRSLDLPHDWSIEGKMLPNNPTGGAGGYFPAGIGWYRKTFKAPAEWRAKKSPFILKGFI